MDMPLYHMIAFLMDGFILMQTDFKLSEDGRWVKCWKCAPFIYIEEKQWLLYDSMNTHLQTPAHHNNSLMMANSSFNDQVLAADAAANIEEAEQHQNFTSLHGRGSWLLQGTHTMWSGASEAEQAMWSTYDAGDVDFEIAADETETADWAMKWRNEHNLEDNQTWDFEDEVGSLEGHLKYSEDDQLLAEVMANACEWNKLLIGSCTTWTLIGQSDYHLFPNFDRCWWSWPKGHYWGWVPKCK
jgi:hypothetical protein